MPAELTAYLVLSGDQIASISAAVQDYEVFAGPKEARQQQILLELQIETAKDTLDPMTLGLRYVELEALRRQLQSRQANLRTKVRATLTSAQRAKLDILAQAAQLTTEVAQAQCSFLIDAPKASSESGIIPAQGCLASSIKIPPRLPPSVMRPHGSGR